MILAREVDRDPKVMLAIRPPGLDIGAIEFVRQKLVEEREKRHRRTAHLHRPRRNSLSDRILVMHGGRFMGEVVMTCRLRKLA